MSLKEEVKKLWKLCFSDSDEFVDMYFRLCYSSETTMVIQSENSVVSSLQMPHYSMTFEGTEIQASYISGACTHPDFRGKGVMGQLLEEAFNQMVQRNIPLSILIPANPGLYDYYARTGYAAAFFRSEIKEDISNIIAGNNSLHIEHTTVFNKPIFDYFTKKAHVRPNYVQHSPTDFGAILEDLCIGRGDVSIAYKGKGGPIIGILFAYPENDLLKITEWFAENEAIRDHLIREAAHHHGQSKIIRFEPPSHSPKEQPFGMARIINARMILHLYAVAHPQEKLHIQLTDEQLTFNNGYYYIEKGICTFSLKALKNEHLEWTTQQLSAWLFSRVRLYMSLMLE